MDKILELIKQGRSGALPELAAELGISEEMLLAKLERYEQLGYVRRVKFDPARCGQDCKKCRGCAGSGSKSEPLTYWEQGERLRTRRSGERVSM